MGDRYGRQLVEDVEFSQAQAKKAGVGFDVPPGLFQIHSPRSLPFHDRPFLPGHAHLRAGLVQHGGVNHVSGTFCKGVIRTHTVDTVGFTGFPPRN